MKEFPASAKGKSRNLAGHTEHVIHLAKQLADGKMPGVLSTVDENGRPHLRWMATLSLEDFPLLHTITSPESRKIAHIKKNPSVSWMFSNDEKTIIVNMAGRAHVETDAAVMNRVWRVLEDKSKAYFLNLFSDGPGFAVITTEIEDIECVMPKYDFHFRAEGKALTGEARA